MDWRTKGLWLPAPQDVIGSDLFDGPFSWPVMVMRRSAVAANIATMAGFCERHGVSLAPHGKTTMVRSIVEAQLAAGAWGITVATPNQALVLRKLGAGRILIAQPPAQIPTPQRLGAASAGCLAADRLPFQEPVKDRQGRNSHE